MMRVLSVIGILFLGGAFFTSCITSGRVSTFVVLPDTQTYLEQCPEVFDSQVDWLVANRKKIDAVFQVGDLTQDNSPVEWAYMQKAFHRVSQAGITERFKERFHIDTPCYRTRREKAISFVFGET